MCSPIDGGCFTVLGVWGVARNTDRDGLNGILRSWGYRNHLVVRRKTFRVPLAFLWFLGKKREYFDLGLQVPLEVVVGYPLKGKMHAEVLGFSGAVRIGGVYEGKA